MISDSSKLPEQDQKVAGETPVAMPPSDDQLAMGLRGFGAIGIVAIIVILAGNGLVAPVGAIFCWCGLGGRGRRSGGLGM